MQDNYVADVGDYGKLGLLRSLIGASMTLGVVWFRVPAGHGNPGDGKHRGYLGQPKKFERSDPDLYRRLKQLTTRARQGESDSQLTLESLSRAIPLLENAACCYEYVPPIAGGERRRWWNAALGTVRGRDLVFLDPDNGVAVEHDQLHAPVRFSEDATRKHALVTEIASLLDSGSSVVVYHHLGRPKGGHDLYGLALAKLLSSTAIFREKSLRIHFTRFRRGTARLYLVIAQERHRDALYNSMQEFAVGHWVTDRHFDVPTISEA